MYVVLYWSLRMGAYFFVVALPDWPENYQSHSESVPDETGTLRFN